MNLSNIDFNDPLTKAIVKRKCEKSLLFFTRYFFRVTKKQQYQIAPFVNEIVDKLEKVARGEIKRLIINLPPRSGKTELAVINFMAWCLANNPSAKFIHLSYSNELALGNSNKARELVSSPEFKRMWNINLSEVENAKGNWATNSGGVVYATGAGGQVTGMGAGDIHASPFSGCIILDDPIKPSDANSDIEREKVNERFFSTILTRLNNVNVPIILIMQRLHEDDLSGHLLEKEPNEWVHLKIPAIINEQSFWEYKYPLDDLIKMRKANPRIFAGQMMQEPAPSEGNIVNISWFKYFDNIEGGAIYQSWDTANKDGEENDYSACCTWLVKDNQYYLLDVFKDKLQFPQLIEKMKHHYQVWKPRQIIIEDKASGQQSLQVLRQSTSLPIIAYNPKQRSKSERMIDASIEIQAGRVYVKNKAHWLDEFLHEIKVFPNGKYKDSGDAFSMFINWYRSQKIHYAVVSI